MFGFKIDVEKLHEPTYNNASIKKRLMTIILVAGFLLYPFLNQSVSQELPVPVADNNHKIDEQYAYSRNIIFYSIHFEHAVKLFRWLDQIKLTEIGKETLDAIANSPHKLRIYHNETAMESAGITGAKLTRNLTNGIGEDTYIKFYFDMEREGSNCVLGQSGQYIKYSAQQNLFHELSHARHKMTGTWLYFDSEGQAIREENYFRYQWSQYRYNNYNPRSEDIEDEEVQLNLTGHCYQLDSV